MKKLLGWLIGILVVLTFPVWILVFLIVKLFEKPADLQPAEVEEWLQKMKSGEIDEWWWDDFLSIPIKDPRLDAIRERCEEIWAFDSGYLGKAKDGEYFLQDDGKREICKLIQECRSIEGSSCESKA